MSGARRLWRVEVTLTLLGPILTRGGHSAAPGLDAPIARDGLGRPMLPFSLVKGKLREALREHAIAPCGRIKELLGDKPEDWESRTGRLVVGDFHTTETGRTEDDVIERVEIDPETGSARGRMLVMIEAPFGHGQPVPFRGAIEFIADVPEAHEIHRTIAEGLGAVHSFGALRTVGFGRLMSAETTLAEAGPRSTGAPPPDSSTLPVRLRFDRPLCLVGRKHSGNHFESLESVPGAVLKGALARLLTELTGTVRPVVDPRVPSAAWPNLVAHFDLIRFAEARPVPSAQSSRPTEPPLSLVTYPTRPGQYFDVSLDDGPRLVDDLAPAFSIDWKWAESGLVRSSFGWSSLPRERRTRTAIDEKTGRARDEQLFSYGLVLPEQRRENGTVASFDWLGAVGLERVPEEARPKVADELRDLLGHGLPFVGKTRAVASWEWLAPSPTPSPVAPRPEHVVVLQTDFLLTDPARFAADTDPEAALFAAYADSWRDLSGGSLELVRFFARQSLHGGHLSRRSRQRGYHPFLVTDRGGTFVLRPKDERARKLLTEWRASGLPEPSWVKTAHGNDSDPLWMTCPFLRHAGFGEIVVDPETPRLPDAP